MMISSATASPPESAALSTPFGAHWDGEGTDFTLFAGRAESVTLCLFETPNAGEAVRRVELERDRERPWIWRARLLDAPPGTLYGYRVTGPWAPAEGHFHNPAKLLIDPWARAVTGEPKADPSLFAFEADGTRNDRDSAAALPKCVVTRPPGRAPADDKPRVPWRETVIYEAHVAGMTRLHPRVPEPLRGTYLGLCSEPMLEHFRRLGITSLELLPVFQAAPEAHLLAQGKRNYWGYAPVSFFAPSAAYATGAPVEEFRAMVKTLHAAGLEVILDVVFNHSAEGGLDGPVYGLKGLDARAFYRWSKGRFVDWTGTGNTLDVRSPIVAELVLSSLRFWAGEMGVDGFRFDLGPILGRDPHAFTSAAPLLQAIAADPLLSECKMIAEPWDLGPDGYRLGDFPPPFREWNDRFRDTARRFWRGEASGPLGSQLATRLAGSQDVFHARSPLVSVNFITAHDGFTLRDLVSYERKHNEANGEENRDGRDENLSRNWGVEGPSDDAEIRARRERARRALMATLLLGQGVPMLSHGDEIGRTQRGNNNAYCQDNELAWLDWSSADVDFLDFVAGVLRLRRRHGALRRSSFLTAESVRWLAADGSLLDAEAWRREDLRAFAVEIHPDENESNERLLDETRSDRASSLLLLLNGAEDDVLFALPTRPAGWLPRLETDSGRLDGGAAPDSFLVPAFSLVLLEAAVDR